MRSTSNNIYIHITTSSPLKNYTLTAFKIIKPVIYSYNYIDSNYINLGDGLKRDNLNRITAPTIGFINDNDSVYFKQLTPSSGSPFQSTAKNCLVL